MSVMSIYGNSFGIAFSEVIKKIIRRKGIKYKQLHLLMKDLLFVYGNTIIALNDSEIKNW